MKIPTTSPWGKVQQHEVLADGVLRVHTAGHGGLKLDRERNALIPDYMRRKGGWYEEDSEASIPLVVLGIAGYGETRQVEWYKTFKNYYPAQYELYFDIVLQPGESFRKDQIAFEQENEKNLVVVSAGGSFQEWEQNTPRGFVPVYATIGGARTPGTPQRRFYVPLDEYQARGRFGFVIREPIVYLEIKD